MQKAGILGLWEILWWYPRFGGVSVRLHVHTPKSGTYNSNSQRIGILHEEFGMAKKKKNVSKREQRNLRTQQIVFYVIGIIIILSMVISLVAK
jgi:predicted nucleic acid-binding Zn ribbon protein